MSYIYTHFSIVPDHKWYFDGLGFSQVNWSLSHNKHTALPWREPTSATGGRAVKMAAQLTVQANTERSIKSRRKKKKKLLGCESHCWCNAPQGRNISPLERRTLQLLHLNFLLECTMCGKRGDVWRRFSCLIVWVFHQDQNTLISPSIYYFQS